MLFYAAAPITSAEGTMTELNWDLSEFWVENFILCISVWPTGEFYAVAVHKLDL